MPLSREKLSRAAARWIHLKLQGEGVALLALIKRGKNGKFHYVSAITLDGELGILSKSHVTANLLRRSLTQM